jgi:hypothetical protein
MSRRIPVLAILSLSVYLLPGASVAEAGMGVLGALKARLLSSLHPLPAARQHNLHVYRGWKRQHDGARRERWARVKLQVKNFASKVVEKPLLLEEDGSQAAAHGRRYQPDLAVIRGFGALRWGELWEVSTGAEKRKWDDPLAHPETHKSDQRQKIDEVFSRRGRLYVLDGPAGDHRTSAVRVFKTGPLSGRVRFDVER